MWAKVLCARPYIFSFFWTECSLNVNQVSLANSIVPIFCVITGFL